MWRLGLVMSLLLTLYLGCAFPVNVSAADMKRSQDDKTQDQLQKRADEIVSLCAREAGIPANDPTHRITQDELLRLTACTDRYRKR